eukprot:COSAG04_NODE_6608_length_1294_cov_0.651046_1_plen_138_part_00
MRTPSRSPAGWGPAPSRRVRCRTIGSRRSGRCRARGAKTSAQKEKQEKEEASKGPKVRPPTAAMVLLGCVPVFLAAVLCCFGLAELFCAAACAKKARDKGRELSVSEGACRGVVAQISYKLIPPGTPEHEAAMADAD